MPDARTRDRVMPAAETAARRSYESSGVAACRDLAVTLAWREMVVRYKRSVFGIAWSLAEPIVNVLVYVIVFGLFLQAGRDLTSYPLFVLFGVLAWLFLSSALEQSTSILLEHSSLIRKINFPRELLVLAVVVSRLSALLIGLVFALAVALATSTLGGPVAWERAWLIMPGIACLTALVAGVSLVASAVHVLLRDTQFLVRFALRIAFYACPIVYPLSRVPTWLRPAYELNPLVGILWFFQAMSDPALPPPSPLALTITIAGSFGGGFLGWVVFRRLQPTVADFV